MDLTVHTDYTKNKEDWFQIKTCLDGQSFIKKEGEKYLPFPVALEAPERQEGDFNNQYKVYLSGAHYVNFTLQAVEDLVAGVFRKEPIVENVPKDLEYFNYQDFTKEAVEIVTSYGRAFVIVDYPKTKGGTSKAEEATQNIRAYTVTYRAEDILDWNTERVGGEEVLTLVKTREIYYPSQGETESNEQAYRYRTFYLDSDGNYTIKIEDEESKQIGDIVIPTDAKGNKFKYIPGTFIGPKNNLPKVNQSPVIGISNSNIKHYQTWAELNHTLTYSGHEMIVIEGAPKGFIKEMKKQSIKLTVGPSNALILEGETSKAKTMGGGSSGVDNHIKTIDKLESSMLEQGARIKDKNSGQVESAEALGLKYSGDNSILASIAINVELATLFVYEQLGLFMDVDTNGIEVKLNKTFFEKKADAQIMTALSAGVTAGNLPNRIYLKYLKENGIIDEKEDLKKLEDEAKESNPFIRTNSEG